MTEHPFQNFINLIKFDQELHNLRRGRKDLELQIDEIVQKKEQLERAFVDTKQSVASLKKEVDSTEMLVQELDQLEAEEKKTLDTIKTQREYKSVQAELNAINRKQQEAEKTLIELWNKYETARKQLEDQKAKYSERMSEFDQVVDEKKMAINEITAEYEKREKERRLKTKEVPEEWLEKYANMRAQVSNPVVPVVSDSCSACFYPVPQHDIMKLNAHKLIQCRSCYRLLYLKGIEESLKNEQQAHKN